MKNFTKLLFCALSLASSTAIFAVHKQQIKLSNQYGQDVLVHIDWKMKNFPYTHRPADLILTSKRKNFLLKAPISGYELFSLDVTPASNLSSSLTAGLAGSSLAVGVQTATVGTAAIETGVATAGTVGGVAAAAVVPLTGTMGGIVYAISHSYNKCSKRAHGHKFFVIKAEKHASKIASQKQITIEAYDEAEYNKAIGNEPVVEIDDMSSEDSAEMAE